MADPFFFGYGSLVNTATHSYENFHNAKLSGWRRLWRHTVWYEHAFLSVEPAPESMIEGLIAAVPSADWAALDERERGYQRSAVTKDEIDHPLGPKTPIEMYRVSTDPKTEANDPCSILLSYLDAVVQGFYIRFGEEGVARFFATTKGWDAPVFDDRNDPIYPRAQTLSPTERRLVDKHLADLSVTPMR